MNISELDVFSQLKVALASLAVSNTADMVEILKEADPMFKGLSVEALETFLMEQHSSGNGSLLSALHLFNQAYNIFTTSENVYLVNDSDLKTQTELNEYFQQGNSVDKVQIVKGNRDHYKDMPKEVMKSHLFDNNESFKKISKSLIQNMNAQLGLK
jgi:hypothetical protein